MHALATPGRSQKLEEHETAANKRFHVIRAQPRGLATGCNDWLLTIGFAGHRNV